MQDISDNLKEWPYDKNNHVRIIIGKDGKEKVQVRYQFEIGQMEADGRPDCERHYGKDSMLEHYLGQLEDYKKTNGNDIGFLLNSEACKELRTESQMMHHRYSSLIEIKDYERVIRDTEHNLKIFDLMFSYAAEGKDRMYYEEWRPQLIRTCREARIELCIKNKEYTKALEYANEALKTLNSLGIVVIQADSLQVVHPTFLNGKRRALALFNKYIPKIKRLIKEDKKPEVEKKKDRLREAVANEEFETAAIIRDEIKEMGGDSTI